MDTINKHTRAGTLLHRRTEDIGKNFISIMYLSIALVVCCLTSASFGARIYNEKKLEALNSLLAKLEKSYHHGKCPGVAIDP